jgi:excisionase family DNA binding protein
MTSAPILSVSAETDPESGVPKQLTCPEVAEVLRIGTFTVIELCRTGALRASKPNKAWLIDPADLRAYLDAHANQPATRVADSAVSA